MIHGLQLFQWNKKLVKGKIKLTVKLSVIRKNHQVNHHYKRKKKLKLLII